jgi:hypothetical protein
LKLAHGDAAGHAADERSELATRRYADRGRERPLLTDGGDLLPMIGEFVDGATCGLLEVEPLDSSAPTASP